MPAETLPTTQDVDWAALVKKTWGKEWAKPDPGYEFTGREFKSPLDGGGIYNQDEE